MSPCPRVPSSFCLGLSSQLFAGLFVLSLSGLIGCNPTPKTEVKAQAASAGKVPTEGPSESVEPVVDAGCPHQNGTACAHGDSPSASASAGTKLYGDALDPALAEASLANIMSEPEKFHGQVVKVSGVVKRACTRRGCWMEIAPNAEADAGGCRVTFKDYGFLVPTDSAGSEARLVGAVQVTTIQPAAVQHYESEGARFPHKAADGSAHEVRIVATGVELTRS